MASLVCQSRRPHGHPNQHTQAELKLIQDMRRRNPSLGMVELWHRLRQSGVVKKSLVPKCKDFSEMFGSIRRRKVEVSSNNSSDTSMAANHC